jgi:hypothetical protein
MQEQQAQVKEAITNAAKEEGKKAIEKAVQGTEAEKIVKDILGTGRKDSTVAGDTARAATPVTAEDVQKKLEDEAKKKIQNFLKKKN